MAKVEKDARNPGSWVKVPPFVAITDEVDVLTRSRAIVIGTIATVNGKSCMVGHRGCRYEWCRTHYHRI